MRLRKMCLSPTLKGRRQGWSELRFAPRAKMDFFSERELVTQTGHDRWEWPLVVVKELVDNSLDACEEAGVAPVIEVCCDAGGISVADNGPGIPESTLTGQLDFSVRVSSREAYRSPCRGAQGNALKTLLPLPYILDPQHGRVIVEAHGHRHVVTCGADPISQRPVIQDGKAELPKSKELQICKWREKASFFVRHFFPIGVGISK